MKLSKINNGIFRYFFNFSPQTGIYCQDKFQKLSLQSQWIFLEQIDKSNQKQQLCKKIKIESDGLKKCQEKEFMVLFLIYQMNYLTEFNLYKLNCINSVYILCKDSFFFRGWCEKIVKSGDAQRGITNNNKFISLDVIEAAGFISECFLQNWYFCKSYGFITTSRIADCLSPTWMIFPKWMYLLSMIKF